MFTKTIELFEIYLQDKTSIFAFELTWAGTQNP